MDIKWIGFRFETFFKHRQSMGKVKLLQKIRGIAASFWRVAVSWSAVDTLICLHLSELQIWIFWVLEIVISTLLVFTLLMRVWLWEVMAVCVYPFDLPYLVLLSRCTHTLSFNKYRLKLIMIVQCMFKQIFIYCMYYVWRLTLPLDVSHRLHKIKGLLFHLKQILL